MRDLTIDIINGIESCLANVNYSGTKYPILDTLPKAKSFHHIWIKNISATDSGTKDKEIQDVRIELEVVASGYAQKGNLISITDVANQVISLMKYFMVSNNYIVVQPYLTSYSFIDEIVQADNQQIIVDRKLLTFETVIQEP